MTNSIMTTKYILVRASHPTQWDNWLQQMILLCEKSMTHSYEVRVGSVIVTNSDETVVYVREMRGESHKYYVRWDDVLDISGD